MIRRTLTTLLVVLSLPACAESEGKLPDPRTAPASRSGGEEVGDEAALLSEAESSLSLQRIDSLHIRLDPDGVRQGKLFRILLDPVGARPDAIGGTFAGEPLHFEVGEDGSFWALAAAPIDAVGGAELRIVPTWRGVASAPMIRTISVSGGEYRMERLSVAPEFGGGYSPEIQRRIDSESARAMAVSRNSHRTPRLWSAPIAHPREDRITSGFGHGRTFNGEVQSRHMGTDFAGSVGAPVLAPARGIVALRDSFYLGGNVLYLDHGAGLVTGYLHLDEQLVAQGDTVDAGELIARVGDTGRVTGPHLHWIVRYGEVTVDGLSLLEFR
jgi:hypothetical protein